MAVFISADEAAELVKDGDTIWINAFAAIASPVDLNRAITRRFRRCGKPEHLTLYSAFSFAEWKEDSDIEGYICEGAADCVVIGFFGSLYGTCKAIMENRIEGYNLPGGVMSHMIRASACGASTLFTKIGLNLFVDPRVGGYRLNERSKRELVHLANENGEEGLLYDIPKVDVALLKASFADERGNITFENECASIDCLSVAQATHRNGGKVIVQVARVVNNHMLPRTVNVPAALVDAVVVVPDQKQLTNMDGYYDYICGKYVPTGNILKACREEIRDCQARLDAAQGVLDTAQEDYDAQIRDIERQIRDKEEQMKLVVSFAAKKAELLFANLKMNRVAISLYDVVKSTGEMKDAFKFTYNGRRYDRLSLSEKVRAGMEVSELMKRLTGRNYPQFLDNMESVDDIRNVQPSGQVIMARCVRNADLSVLPANQGKRDAAPKAA